MSEESKVVDAELDKQAATEVAAGEDGEDDEEVEGVEQADAANTEEVAGASAAKKKKSKKAKMKSAIGMGDKKTEAGSSSNPASKLTPNMVEQLLEMNPSLKNEVSNMNKDQAADKLKKLDVADLITGMSIGGKNQKDMASYKFWQTQPVQRFDEATPIEEGPIKIIDPEQVPKEGKPLMKMFEWVTMNLEDEKELEEVYHLLYGHYVEDDDATFRFNYSVSFLDWALKSPGWRNDWHIGVRATDSRRLVAFISGVPQRLRVRNNILNSVEINFLCVHKKLRSKRLAPVLIQEITRRCYINGIYQAIYTAGIVLPKPVSTCRYFHRSIDWSKLYEVGFSPLPAKSTRQRQISHFKLPDSTSTAGLRPATSNDVPAIKDLLDRYLARFELAPDLDASEIEHWLMHSPKTAEQVIWTYVVENPSSKHLTDFFSFYCLESSVIGNPKHDNVRAAYLFYYATETAFKPNEEGLKERLNLLINDALILAKKFKFDVFNALTLLDNPLFLEQQRFGPGDGQLHYYIFNYRTAPIAGGVNSRNGVDAEKRGGVGVVML